MRKGIVLAGGSGTRLHPLTLAVCKQLLPVYDKPLIYYPITTLMLAGITDMLIITTPHDLKLLQRALGDGERWGVKFTYAVQERPNGIAQALIIGRDYLCGEPCALILGDNIFYGDGLGELLRRAASANAGATVLVYWVQDPERYGVLEFDAGYRPLRIVEKPKEPRSNYAVTGLYFYDAQAPDIAATLRPSERGELEITDVNEAYLKAGQLTVERFGRGYAWLDAGTPESLLESSQFIRIVEQRQGLKIACPEEIAFRMGYIDLMQFRELAERVKGTSYGAYLARQVDEAERQDR